MSKKKITLSLTEQIKKCESAQQLKSEVLGSFSIGKGKRIKCF
jgi:hypothetical protein